MYLISNNQRGYLSHELFSAWRTGPVSGTETGVILNLGSVQKTPESTEQAAEGQHGQMVCCTNMTHPSVGFPSSEIQRLCFASWFSTLFHS